MRTALVAGLIVTGITLLLAFGRALSNADFIYMCATAALLDEGQLVATPYFPPGYPALLWLVTKAGLLLWPGMTALHAGSLLAALGAGLSAGALAYGARMYRIPPAPALLLGLLGASLPDVAEIGFNPHVDALYTGLALTLIVATLRSLPVGAEQGSPRRGQAAAGTGRSTAPPLLAALCGVLLLSLRWHAVLVVGTCLLLLLLHAGRKGAAARPTAFALLLAVLLAGGGSYALLYNAAGSFQTAAPLQVATGAVYRQYGPGRELQAVSEVFSDYAGWMQNAPPVTTAMLLDAERANLPRFLTRKAVLAGAGLCLLLALVYRRWPPQAHWLLLFIPGYAATVATTYFTPRASALLELCGLLLAASALSLVFTQDEHELRGQKLQQRRLHFKPNAPRLRLDPALAGGLLVLACSAGMAWNAWRVGRDIYLPQRRIAAERNAVYAQALALAGGDAAAIYGRFDLLPPAGHMPWCLPGPSYTRLWLDDPRVAQHVDGLLPVFELSGGTLPPRAASISDGGKVPPPLSETDGTSPVPPEIQVVLLWPGLDAPQADRLAVLFETGPETWQPVEAASSQARLWRRR